MKTLFTVAVMLWCCGNVFAQLDVITVSKPNKQVVFDSTYNFDYEHIDALVGQDVVLLQRSVYNEEVENMLSRELFVQIGHSPKPVRKYSEVAGKQYRVNRVVDSSLGNLSSFNCLLYELIEEDTKDTIYYNLGNIHRRSELSSIAPLLTIGYFEKQKALYKGKTLRAMSTYAKPLMDLKTGEACCYIEKYDIYTCVDVAIVDTPQYWCVLPAYILRDAKGKEFFVPVDLGAGGMSNFPHIGFLEIFTGVTNVLELYRLNDQPKKTAGKAAYDSTYIFDARRPQVLIGQQVMLLEPNENVSGQALFTKENGQLKALSGIESYPLVGDVFTITKMEKITWHGRQTLYTMNGRTGAVYWYLLDVNGEISQYTPIIPIGFLKKVEKMYTGKKVMVVWDYNIPGKVVQKLEAHGLEFLRVDFKRYHNYAGEHVEPHYVLKYPDGMEYWARVQEGRVIKIQPRVIKIQSRLRDSEGLFL